MNTLVKDVMTAQVVWVEQDAPFTEIAAALREYRVSAFPVLNQAGELTGVVSESDLLAKLALGGGEDGMPGMITGILHQHESEKARAVTAAELMTSPAVTVSPTTSPAGSATCRGSSRSATASTTQRLARTRSTSSPDSRSTKDRALGDLSPWNSQCRVPNVLLRQPSARSARGNRTAGPADFGVPARRPRDRPARRAP